uniref:HMG box domain-containing protein n=1 Tax=Equus caballus TaxID=9796 RepID=A0A9L0TPB3_HORSE
DTEGTDRPRPPRHSREAPVPAEFLLPSPDGPGGLPPGSSVIQAHCRDLASLPVQQVVLANQRDPKEQDTEEPKKRRGGWPKGKKRKPLRDLSVPRAPTTGYAIFLNEQRSQLRAEHPDLPFTEITKMLAVQWDQLSHEKKRLPCRRSSKAEFKACLTPLSAVPSVGLKSLQSSDHMWQNGEDHREAGFS